MSNATYPSGVPRDDDEAQADMARQGGGVA